MACPLVGPLWETMLVTLCTEQPDAAQLGGMALLPRDFQFTFCPQPRETEAKHTFPIWIADAASCPASCAGISLNPFMRPALKFPAGYSQGRKTGRFPGAGPSGGWGSLGRPLFVPGGEGHPGAEPGRGPGEQAGAGGSHPLSEGAGRGRREAAQAGDPGRRPRQRRAGAGRSGSHERSSLLRALWGTDSRPRARGPMVCGCLGKDRTHEQQNSGCFSVGWELLRGYDRPGQGQEEGRVGTE